jgi:Na+/H+-dicarboxylate symporter
LRGVPAAAEGAGDGLNRLLARMYGMPLSSGAVLWIALTAAAASFSIPGVPQASFLVMSGVLVTVGVPAEGVALLIAADTIPDMMGTMANATGDMVATIVVARATDDSAMLAGGAVDLRELSVEPTEG